MPSSKHRNKRTSLQKLRKKKNITTTHTATNPTNNLTLPNHDNSKTSTFTSNLATKQKKLPLLLTESEAETTPTAILKLHDQLIKSQTEKPQQLDAWESAWRSKEIKGSDLARDSQTDSDQTPSVASSVSVLSNSRQYPYQNLDENSETFEEVELNLESETGGVQEKKPTEDGIDYEKDNSTTGIKSLSNKSSNHSKNHKIESNSNSHGAGRTNKLKHQSTETKTTKTNSHNFSLINSITYQNPPNKFKQQEGNTSQPSASKIQNSNYPNHTANSSPHKISRQISPSEQDDIDILSNQSDVSRKSSNPFID